MKENLLIFFLALFLTSTFLSPTAQAATPISIEVITTFDYPGVGRTYPSAINDDNTIVGFYRMGQIARRGFTRSANGDFSAPIIDPDDAHRDTLAFGINNDGTISGYFFGADDYHGFFLSAGAYSQYDVPGSSGTVVEGINDAGDFAGYYYTPRNIPKGFINVGGTVTTIRITGGTYVTARQINAADQVVGYYADSSNDVTGFYSDASGRLHYPAVFPGARDTYLYGINDRGWIVGNYVDRSKFRLGHGIFFLPPDQFATLDYAGSKEVVLTGINHRGFICGYYTDGNLVHGLLARVRNVPR